MASANKMKSDMQELSMEKGRHSATACRWCVAGAARVNVRGNQHTHSLAFAALQVIATVSLTITEVNDAPVLTNQSATLAEDSSITLVPLAAFDVDGDALTAFVVAGPAHDKLTVNADGTFRYQADANYFGTDSFTYRVNDGKLDSNIATVSLTVKAVNDAPVAQDGTAALDEDSSIVLDLRSLGYDIDSSVLTVDIVGAPAHGSLVANANGTFTYSPAANYNGGDSIRFRLNDGQLLSNVATLSLTVRAVNDGPVAGASLVTGTEDTPVLLRWSAFAVSDIDGDALTVRLTSLPADGVLQVLQANGTWALAGVGNSFTQADLDAGKLRFTPALNAAGGAGFADAGYGNKHEHYARLGYTVSDGVATSVQAYVGIDIKAVADTATIDLLGNTIQRQVFGTGFESAPNISSQSTLVAASMFEGWSLVTRIDEHGVGRGLGGGKDGFEIWSTGDQMADATDHLHTVSAAANGGKNFLEINDAGGSQFQTLGIARAITTDKGASYSLGFDLAGRLGYGSDTTRIAVYVDDTLIATFNNTSANDALNWQHAVAKFTGNGGKQTIRIVTDATDRQKSGRGMLLDNVALDQTVKLNDGVQGGSVMLQGLKAGLADTDGSEALRLTLAGLPVGTFISDGVHAFTVTAEQPVADITGWNTYAMALKPPASFSGNLTLKVSATATEGANGSQAVISQDIVVHVEAMAQAPVLTLLPSQVAVSRQVFDTSWENVCDSTYGATIIDASQFAGWDGLPVGAYKDDAFLVWGDGDLMRNALGQNVQVHPASGAGSEWLQLTNGVNSSSNAKYQSTGIERSFQTMVGGSYTFTLDYAGALGLAAANTRIGVYVDGVQIGSYAGTSSNSALNWEALSFSFTGNGQVRTLRIQLEGGTDTSTAKGVMIEALNLVETFPSTATTSYGLVNGKVSLPVMHAKLANGDTDATLKTQLSGLAAGSVLSDGVHQLTVWSATTAVDISTWDLAALVIKPPYNFAGTMAVQVKSTSTELSNGSAATVVRDITVRVLQGTACATPASLNPYVSYVADTAPSSSTQGVVVTSTGTIDTYLSIYIPDLVAMTQQQATEDSTETMEQWMKRMSQQLGSAMHEQMASLFSK